MLSRAGDSLSGREMQPRPPAAMGRSFLGKQVSHFCGISQVFPFWHHSGRALEPPEKLCVPHSSRDGLWHVLWDIQLASRAAPSVMFWLAVLVLTIPKTQGCALSSQGPLEGMEFGGTELVAAHGKAGTTGYQAVLGTSLFSPQKPSSGAVNNK